MSKFNKPKTPYSQVPNQAMWDQRLSLSALGMWAFLWSLPEKWDFSIKGLATCRGCGITAATSAIQALENAGYLERVQRRKGSKFDGYDYNLIEKPLGAITILHKKRLKTDNGKTVNGETNYGDSITCKNSDNIKNTNITNNNIINNYSLVVDEELIKMLEKEGIK